MPTLNIHYKAEPTLALFHKSPAFVRGVMGPVGCLAPDTLVITEYGAMPICQIDRPMRVLSWNDQKHRFELSLCGGAFPKGTDYLYRVTTSQGEFVASGHHRTLCADDSYQRVDRLSPGQSLSLCFDSQLLTSGASAPLSSHVDDLGLRQKAANYLARYAESARRYGQQFLVARDNDLISSPLLNGVRESILYRGSCVSERRGGLPVPLQAHNHLDLCAGQRQTDGYFGQVEPLPLTVEGSFSTLPSSHNEGSGRPSLRSPWTIACHLIAKLYAKCFRSYSTSRTERTIISVERESFQQSYWDMQVLNTNNYVTIDGAIHHNSGKSVGCWEELINKSMCQKAWKDGVRRTRWAVIRNTYPELKTTTIKTATDWTPEPIMIMNWGSPVTGNIKFKLEDETIVHAEVLFLALDSPKDVKKLLSLELTGAWLNEARELPYEVIQGVSMRLGRFPAKRYGGPSWVGMFMDTNPPDDDHWWFKYAEQERPEDWDFYRQPPALLRYADGKGGFLYINNKEAENVQNQPLGYRYWHNMISGKSLDWINVYVMGNYGTIEDGKPVYPEYNDSIHCAKEDIEPLRGLPLRLGWDFGLCYDDQTEVLTQEGWKFFKDVDADKDLAATRNPETGTMEYTPINFKVDRHYDGDMLEWANTEINFCVTPEHRVPFTYRDTPDKVHFSEAQWLSENMGGHHYVDLLAQWRPDFDDKATYFGMKAGIFASFMGFYLSEGSVDNNRITIYQMERHQDWEELLSKTGLNWKWFDHGKSCGWRAGAPNLAPWLRTFGKANQKRVPRQIREMPAGYILAFINAYTAGDGHVRMQPNGSIEHTIYTSSEAMAGDLQELAQKVGWNASASYVPSQQSTIVENGAERVIISNGGYSICFKKRASRAELLKKNFKRIKYSGRIYCLNVPYHTLYVRRGGRAHWNGNTPACAIFQITPSGRCLVLDEVVALDMGVRRFVRDVVKPHLSNNYDGMNIISVGDPAGTQRSQTKEDTCMQILAEEGLRTSPAYTQETVARREAVSVFLTGIDVDGIPNFQLSPKCRYLRKGFNGAFKYDRVQVANEERYKDKVTKNVYSHVHEGLQYGLLEVVKGYRVRKPTVRKGPPRTALGWT